MGWVNSGQLQVARCKMQITPSLLLRWCSLARVRTEILQTTLAIHISYHVAEKMFGSEALKLPLVAFVIYL